MRDFHTLRRAHNLTQADLAQATGTRQATISAIEQGQTRPRNATKKRIAEALQVSLDELNAALMVTQQQSQQEKSVQDWAFLAGLDADLRAGVAQILVSHDTLPR